MRRVVCGLDSAHEYRKARANHTGKDRIRHNRVFGKIPTQQRHGDGRFTDQFGRHYLEGFSDRSLRICRARGGAEQCDRLVVELPLATTHSRPFFKTPGIRWAYSASKTRFHLSLVGRASQYYGGSSGTAAAADRSTRRQGRVGKAGRESCKIRNQVGGSYCRDVVQNTSSERYGRVRQLRKPGSG
jgi:hypothetical protein